VIIKLFSKEIKPVEKSEDLFVALLDKRRYKRVFDMLRQRAEKDYHRNFSYANHPELSLRWILSHEKLVIKWILKKIRKKKYTVSPARESPFVIDEKERLLYRLEWPDRILQTVLAEALAELWDSQFSDKLFSFRKGYSVWQAVGRAVKFVRKNNDLPLYILKRDVKSYGDSISHKILFQQIEKYLPNVEPFIIDLIEQFIKYDYVGIDGENHKKTVGLPTGMPLNCVLENLFMMPMDDAMLNNNHPARKRAPLLKQEGSKNHPARSASTQLLPCQGEVVEDRRGQQKGSNDNHLNVQVQEFPSINSNKGFISYMRYGDDIWVACRDYETILNAKNKLDEICSELELEWNEEKCGEYILVNKDARTNLKSKISKSCADVQDLGVKHLNIENFLLNIEYLGFRSTSYITHLGVSITADGTVVIPREKMVVWRKQLKQILKRADYRSRLMEFDERTRLRQLIYFANKFFFDQNLRFRKIDYLLTIVTKDNYYIELDRWVAMVILSVLHGRFSKTNFRRTPFKVLKKEGLESLYMRRKGMMKRRHR